MDVLFLEKNYSKINFKKKIKYFSLSKYNFEYGLIILAFIEYLKSNFKYSIRFFYLLTFLKKYRPKIIIGNQFNFSLLVLIQILLLLLSYIQYDICTSNPLVTIFYICNSVVVLVGWGTWHSLPVCGCI